MRGNDKARPSAGSFSVSGRVKCTCGRFLAALGPGMSFSCRREDARLDPPEFGLALSCRCGASWMLVQDPPRRPATEPRKLRAFVIDDDERVRTLMRLALERRGYEALAFDHAIPCAECPVPPGQTCADVILCDVAMPGTTGLEFVQNQKKCGCRTQHFALMSGTWSSDDLDRAQELGCEVFHKPFAGKELGGWLADCETEMDRSELLDATYQEAYKNE